jgi:hypothetical protein
MHRDEFLMSCAYWATRTKAAHLSSEKRVRVWYGIVRSRAREYDLFDDAA